MKRRASSSELSTLPLLTKVTKSPRVLRSILATYCNGYSRATFLTTLIDFILQNVRPWAVNIDANHFSSHITLCDSNYGIANCSVKADDVLNSFSNVRDLDSIKPFTVSNLRIIQNSPHTAVRSLKPYLGFLFSAAMCRSLISVQSASNLYQRDILSSTQPNSEGLTCSSPCSLTVWMKPLTTDQRVGEFKSSSLLDPELNLMLQRAVSNLWRDLKEWNLAARAYFVTNSVFQRSLLVPKIVLFFWIQEVQNT